MKKIVVFVLAMALVLGNGFVMFEGVMASAASTSTGTQLQDISLTYPVEVTVGPEITLNCDTATSTMTPPISGISGGTASSSRDCNIITNNLTGYVMTIKPSTDPALVNTVSSSITFANLHSNLLSWADATGANTLFGFTVSGTDSDSAFSGGTLWRGFSGTNAVQIASRNVATAVTGVTTTVAYAASAGPSAAQPSGLYRAWITVTAHMQ